MSPSCAGRAWDEYDHAHPSSQWAPASKSLQWSHPTTLLWRALTDTILCWCLSSKCCPRTCFDDDFFVLAFRAHLVAVLTRAGRSRGRRRLARNAAACLCTVRVPWLLMAALRAGAVATSVGTWGPMARDSHRGSCLGRASAWYRDLRSYTACCLCVCANLRHEGSRHSESDKEIPTKGYPKGPNSRIAPCSYWEYHMG